MSKLPACSGCQELKPPTALDPVLASMVRSPGKPPDVIQKSIVRLSGIVVPLPAMNPIGTTYTSGIKSLLGLVTTAHPSPCTVVAGTFVLGVVRPVVYKIVTSAMLFAVP